MATANITIGPTGAVGSLYVNTATGVTSVAPAYYPIPNTYASPPTFGSDVIIRREGKEDLLVAKTLEMLLDRLCIIMPAIDLIEKYPALREAYENYKLIETMVKNGNEDNG
jgi:hypothetical protein